MSSTPSAADVRELERRGYRVWIAPEVGELDGWRLRHAHGVTGRANSVWPNEDGAVWKLDAKIDAVERWYADRGLPPRFQLTSAAVPAGLEGALGGRGYRQAGDAVSVRIASLDDGATEADAELADEPDDAWIALWTESRSFDRLDVARALLLGDGAPVAFAGRSGAAIGRAVALGDGWLGISSMLTVPVARGRGHGSRVLAALLAWGRARGCSRALLQVESTNEPALRLYDRFGFRAHHAYRYLVAG